VNFDEVQELLDIPIMLVFPWFKTGEFVRDYMTYDDISITLDLELMFQGRDNNLNVTLDLLNKLFLR